MPRAGFITVGEALEHVLAGAASIQNSEAVIEGMRSANRDVRISGLEAAACSDCHDSGWRRRNVGAEEPGFGALVPCQCGAGAAIVQRRQDRVWQAAGIPPKFSAYTLDSLAGRDGKFGLSERLREWQVSRHWLLLWGSPGTCKSGAAVALLREHQAAGGQGLFMLLNRILDRMQATFGASDDQPGYQEAFQTLVDAELLVLDDIGANKKPLSPWGKEQLFKIVDARDLEERQTILTTNLNASSGEFAAYVGAPTWDRIRGRCGRWIVETTGPSQRGLDLED